MDNKNVLHNIKLKCELHSFKMRILKVVLFVLFPAGITPVVETFRI
jgi:hypothetical protein